MKAQAINGKYILNVVWGEDAENLCDKNEFEYVWNNAESLGVSIKTYSFDSQQELNAFMLAMEETVGWHGYVREEIAPIGTTVKEELKAPPVQPIKGLSYGEYLLSCLWKMFDKKFMNMEYDNQYRLIPELYAEFEQSEYNDQLTGQYECIIRFLRNKYKID
jgi:hypothetical protein